MGVAKNWGCRPGPTPGDDMAVKQRKAMAMGVAVDQGESHVKTGWSKTEGPGRVCVPGWRD